MIEDLYQRFLLKTKMHHIKITVFDTWLAIIELSDEQGVCRATQRSIMNSKRRKVSKAETVSSHTKKLEADGLLKITDHKTDLQHTKQYTIPYPDGDPNGDPIRDEILYYRKVVKKGDEETRPHSPFSRTSVTELERDGFDGLPNGRHEPPEEKEKKRKLFTLLPQITRPPMSGEYIKVLYDDYHEDKIWEAVNEVRSFMRIDKKRNLTNKTKADFSADFLSYLTGRLKKRKDYRDASNKAGANKPPGSGQKSREGAQISSGRHSGKRSRLADQHAEEDKDLKEDTFAKSIERGAKEYALSKQDA